MVMCSTYGLDAIVFSFAQSTQSIKTGGYIM